MPTATTADVSLYRRHRYPAEVIAHALWLYFRFSLRVRDVEEDRLASYPPVLRRVLPNTEHRRHKG